MTKKLALAVLGLLNVLCVYWIFWILQLLVYGVNGLLIPSHVLESSRVASLVLRWSINLTEAILLFAGIALLNFAVFEKIGLSNSRYVAQALFLIELIATMSLITSIFISIANAGR